MVTLYNKIANQSPERLAALSDGVFAFALTLLVLDLRLPDPGGIHSEHDLWRALALLTPSIVMYLMSFLTLGIFWNGQQTQMNFLARCDRDLTWMYIAFLFAVTLLPFSTKLLAAFLSYRTALLVYWLNILLLGSVLYLCWRYANRAGLIKEDTPREIRRAIRRRVVIAQLMYAAGAVLCVINTRWSIACIFVVQLYYAVAPRRLQVGRV
ncbi:MAG: TMEM175 family protein [Acidobacteriota bacterium]